MGELLTFSEIDDADPNSRKAEIISATANLALRVQKMVREAGVCVSVGETMCQLVCKADSHTCTYYIAHFRNQDRQAIANATCIGASH